MKDLDRNKRYIIKRATRYQKKCILEWLKKNDKAWDFIDYIYADRVLLFSNGEWFVELIYNVNIHDDDVYCATELFE